jgi:hypothetical protein
VTDVAAGDLHNVVLTTEPVAVLVTGNAARVPAGDRPIVQRLATIGYGVVLVDDDELGGAIGTARLGSAAVVVVASSVRVSLTTFGTSLRTLPVPVVILEPFIADDLALAPARGGKEVSAQTHAQVRLDHPLAGGLTARSHRMTTSPTSFGVYTPVPSAVVVATRVGSNAAEVFGIEAGDALAVGTAPARRVGLFLTYQVPPLATANAWRIFDASVTWAVD